MKKTLSERLRDLREDHDLTQQQIAYLLHKDRSTYTYYETGKTEPSLHDLIALADFHKVSLDYLVGRSNKRTFHP